ncbi:hypothetical protein AAW01_11855 [Aurantiacibacter gangjinensis]|uniref:Beta-lactamase-related domain-containing protein n=1 Tax=Aurantiacibacter gangjinensis TaxID=502682 RepID=A0A0G9MNM3_9SPHN|nr:hypothetical protein AAW01_11855 [Aurantiacibacter gangjinensis]
MNPVHVLGDEERVDEPPPFMSEAIAALGEDFPGEAMLYREGMNYWLRTAESCGDGHAQGNIWPWASVTKQVIATLVMQEVERGRVALDALAVSYLPFPASPDAGSPTVRQLLRHQSGLRNPDDTPDDANGIPDFYSTGDHGVDWCLADRGEAVAEGWTYNNCDYIVLGALLEAVTGQPLAGLVNARFREAGLPQMQLPARRPRGVRHYAPDFPIDISRFGASGALLGSLHDMIAFDRALLDGRLLSGESRELMWDSDPQMGYMALGQWVYELPLDGCDTPTRIVERRGDIGAYEVRNFIVPERDIALAMVVHDADFSFGEPWDTGGMSHSVLSAAVCGARA